MANAAVLKIRENLDDNITIEQLVTEWCNAYEVDVDDEGGIWIANPMNGHWLDADSVAEFVAWVEKR